MNLTEKLKSCFFNDHIMLVVIMLNTATLFVGGCIGGSMLFEIIDVMFTLVFVLEAAVKISQSGWKAYWANRWNRFDFIILLISLPSLANPLIEQTMATNTVLALRSMRLFKSFKMFHFIPNIEKLLNGVRLAMRSSFLVVIAFVLLLIIFSILSSIIFGKVAPEYFETPLISIYSLFRLFTIEGWYEIPDAIVANGSAAWAFFARCYFSALVFCGGIIGMSLINSIFVDTMVGDNNDEVLKKLEDIERQLKELKKGQDKE